MLSPHYAIAADARGHTTSPEKQVLEEEELAKLQQELWLHPRDCTEKVPMVLCIGLFWKQHAAVLHKVDHVKSQLIALVQHSVICYQTHSRGLWSCFLLYMKGL